MQVMTLLSDRRGRRERAARHDAHRVRARPPLVRRLVLRQWRHPLCGRRAHPPRPGHLPGVPCADVRPDVGVREATLSAVALAKSTEESIVFRLSRLPGERG